MATPSEWRALIRRWLTHRADVSLVAGTTEFAEPVPGPVHSQVPCYCTRARARVQTEGSLTERPDFEVVFDPEFPLTINATLTNVRNRQGVVLMERGRVTRIDPLEHVDLGDLVMTALVVVN